MTEHNSEPVSLQHESIGALQERANRRRQRHKQFQHAVADVRNTLNPLLESPARSLRGLPTRYLLHTLVALLVPAALLLSSLPARPLTQPAETRPLALNETPAELGPIVLDDYTVDVPRAGDPPIPESEAIPVPLSLTSRSEALAPFVAQASIVDDIDARLRNGPGLEYDEVGQLAGSSPIQVMGRYGEWLQVREAAGETTYWVAGELINLQAATIHSLFEVQEQDIPAPPPPKVASVQESNLNLRDGPGTNYVAMTKLESGQQLDLIEQYQGWIHVSTGDMEGWVSADYLAMQEGVIGRVPVTETIPDANPSLVASVNENSVNLRRGPGTSYARVGKVDAGTAVDLLARHKEWFRVQLADGTKAWVFSDLLSMDAMVRRRIPYTDNIPALPSVARATTTNNNSSSRAAQPAAPAAPAAPVYVPASGDVASFALQFVGYRYVWGGASPAGFDCSGFTSYVYRQFGVYLPHSAAGQFSTAYGASVGSIANLAPGDLVFFAGTNGPGITHVGLHIGGGRVVHALSPGLGVQVSSIYEGYWISHYYGAIRPYR